MWVAGREDGLVECLASETVHCSEFSTGPLKETGRVGHLDSKWGIQKGEGWSTLRGICWDELIVPETESYSALLTA